MSVIQMPGNPTTKRGEEQRCPFCGFTYPTVQKRDGTFVIVQDCIVAALEPIAAIVDSSGRALFSSPRAVMQATRFIEKQDCIPHQALCGAYAQTRGFKVLPITKALAPPPPPCKCGHPWVVHIHHVKGDNGNIDSHESGCQLEDCDCEGYEEQEKEPAGEPS